MKLALFDDHRLGVVRGDEIVDVTAALPAHDTDLGASFLVRLCRDLPALRPGLDAAAAAGTPVPLESVCLRAPAPNPSKVVAAASNYSDHVDEMRPRGLADWMYDFDVFLKAPSSIVDPDTEISLPPVEEVHYEGELGFVIGVGGKDIDVASAMDHVLGYTIVLDMTERGKGDRSRRKSHDGFTPIGPWLVTVDDVGPWEDLEIRLWLNGDLRQDVRAGDMLKSIPEIIAYASSVMTLVSGDVFATDAPPGVGR